MLSGEVYLLNTREEIGFLLALALVVAMVAVLWLVIARA